ncbi:hypothetical protein [Loigolactobacillus jiayinensis]|uniref:Glycosyltransferase RgtA/B/C/D-like domain-containing protein n=1 Tax=Loigolactobacillus jiayinensis TaxID=2486016 RepID=A0ABW1RCD0_9LACO|nr:hypothetical protein [Loigolactobacillus jiayinensis]
MFLKRMIKLIIKHERYLLCLNIIFFCLYFYLLTYHLGSVPRLFIDEVNYANEVRSFASFGTDIHGLHFPVYLSSVWGQGQSVLYAIFSVPFVKIFGFSILVFRFPFVLLTFSLLVLLFVLLYFKMKQRKLATFVNIAIITTPWTFISSRWILDANVAPVIFLFGVLSLWLGLISPIFLHRYIYLVMGAVLLALTTYGYITAWIYLPILCVLYLIYFLRNKLLSAREYLVFSVFLVILVLPIIYFAYRVNVVHASSASKFLFFDIPPLPANRVESLINFSQSNLLLEMLKNSLNGISVYFKGTDGLAWNSVSPFGAIMPWSLLFIPIGMFTSNMAIDHRVRQFKKLICLNIVAFIPLMFIVIPNYNHWNFLNINLSVMMGFGLYEVFNTIKNMGKFRILIPVMPLLLFVWFINQAYFGVGGKGTFYESQQISYSEVEKINTIMQRKKFDGKWLFINNLSRMFPYFKLVQQPVDNNTYLSISGQKDNFGKNMGLVKKYDYLKDMSVVGKAKSGDLAIVAPNFINPNWEKITDITFGGAPYLLVRKIDGN